MSINICAPTWDAYDSYGIIAGALADNFGKREHVNKIGVRRWVSREIVPVLGGVLLGYPTLYEHYGSLPNAGRRVAVTMFESSKLPAGWVEHLNRCDAVVVPVQWCADVFRANGVRVPIHVVPLGINPVYSDVKRDVRKNRPYTFLAFGDRASRKGWDVAWRAFRLAFSGRDDVRLIIKCREGGLLNINSSDNNVDFLREDLTHEAMAELYASCDCLVFPTRGEGFGLPPREFAATGGVSLVTRFAGTAEHLEQWGYGISYRSVPAWNGYSEKLADCGEWAEPDTTMLVTQMRAMVEMESIMYRVSIKNRSPIAELYDWARFADCVYKIFRGESWQ